jgi:NAD(P)-dependent dehydrogenase (short-subunit alcohol dehydrogenase family)
MDITPEQVYSEFAVNVYGALFMAKSVVGVGKMSEGGRIINIGTVYSKMGPSSAGAYAAAKAAQDSLTTSLAGEVSEELL